MKQQQQRQKKKWRRKRKAKHKKNKKLLQKLQIAEKATKKSGVTLTNGLSVLEMSDTTTEVSPL